MCDRAGDIVVADSVTDLDDGARCAIVATGSHGGSYSAAVALSRGVRAILFNDAGVGKSRAGVRGLDLLDEYAVAAVAILHRSARIGNGRDTLGGIIGHVNSSASRFGCYVGMAGNEAAAALRSATCLPPRLPTGCREESRTLVKDGPRQVWALDSASLIREEDAGHIVVTGSHGGLVGGLPSRAIKTDVRAAVFNDAGRGLAGAGTSRLPILAERGIAAFAVASDSAEIGSGLSTYRDGSVSEVNSVARGLGAREGMPVGVVIDRFLEIDQGLSSLADPV